MTTRNPILEAPTAPAAPPPDAKRPAEKVTLDVTGMSCASCQAHVQNALRKQPGVSEARVNLITGEAAVQFDPSVCTVPALVDAVAQAGYGASPRPQGAGGAADVDEQEARDTAHREEFRDLRRKAVG